MIILVRFLKASVPIDGVVVCFSLSIVFVRYTPYVRNNISYGMYSIREPRDPRSGRVHLSVRYSTEVVVKYVLRNVDQRSFVSG
jgi:hypothetical protein